MALTIVHFDPRRSVLPGRIGRRIPWKRPLRNFGDLVGPIIVDEVRRELGLGSPRGENRLLAVGSIMHMSQPGDVVWGAGANGKTVHADGSLRLGAVPDVDVRAVRGPSTRRVLQEAGSDVPAVFGDPALLWPRYWPREHYASGPTRTVGVVPNFNDAHAYRGPDVIDPRGEPHEVIGQIARSDFVCGSSLHGIVLAEALGIPARLIRSGAEHPFKYDDYYASTGRDAYRIATSVEEAVAMGGERPPEWDPRPLFDAFPRDLWSADPTS